MYEFFFVWWFKMAANPICIPQSKSSQVNKKSIINNELRSNQVNMEKEYQKIQKFHGYLPKRSKRNYVSKFSFNRRYDIRQIRQNQTQRSIAYRNRNGGQNGNNGNNVVH
jgi:hypothetical protein